MSLSDALQILFWVVVSVVGGWWVVFGYWRLRSEITRHSEGEAPLRSSRQVIWRDPGSISAADLDAAASSETRGAAAQSDCRRGPDQW